MDVAPTWWEVKKTIPMRGQETSVLNLWAMRSQKTIPMRGQETDILLSGLGP